MLLASALSGPDAAERYGVAASATLDRGLLLVQRVPRSAGHWLAVAEAAIRGPLQVAVATDGPSALLDAARRHAPGGVVVVGGAPDSTPLLADRPLVGGAAAAYVCRGFVCDRPVTDVDALLDALAR